MIEISNFQIPEVKINPATFFEALKFAREHIDGQILLQAMIRDVGAHSWRDFLVGCTVGYKMRSRSKGKINSPYSNPTENYRWSSAANFKLEEGKKVAGRDYCAERKAIENVLANNPEFIFSIFTVSSETGANTQEGSPHDILHPCVECRNFMRELLHKGIISPSTLLVSVKDSGNYWQRGKQKFRYSDIENFARNYQDQKRVESTVGELLGQYQQDKKII